MVTGSASERPAGPPRHIVAILLCVIPLSQIPLDVYTPALPQMVTDLGSTSMTMQNTVTVATTVREHQYAIAQ